MKKSMNLIALVAISVLTATPAWSESPPHLVVVTAPGIPTALREPVARAAGELLYRGEPGTRVTVLAGRESRIVADVAVPTGPTVLRQQRVAGAIGSTVQAILGANELGAPFPVMSVLDVVATQLKVTNATVILVGPSFYHDPRHETFSFTKGWPSDAHLGAGIDGSIFSTVERAHQLDGMAVHWLVTDAGTARNENHARGVARFWHLYVASQGGVLPSYSPDPVIVFDNARTGRTQVINAPVFNPADSEVVMRSWSVEVAHQENRRKPAASRTNVLVQTNVVVATNVVVVTNVIAAVMPRVAAGNTGIGIGWNAPRGERVDLDLYVRSPRDGGELSYRNTRTATGRYFRDITQSLQTSDDNWRNLWEFVELQGDQLPNEVWVHLYHGRGPVAGQLRIQHRGREHAIPFAFPEVRRAGGWFGGNRTGDERWLRIDLGTLRDTP